MDLDLYNKSRIRLPKERYKSDPGHGLWTFSYIFITFRDAPDIRLDNLVFLDIRYPAACPNGKADIRSSKRPDIQSNVQRRNYN